MLQTEIRRVDPYFWKDALIGMISNGVSVSSADWTEWCIQICYRWTRIPEEQWPANDNNLNWEPLFGRDRNITPTQQLESIICGIGLAMDELGLDTSFFPATRYVIQSIPDDWDTFRSVVTTTCSDIVVSWLSAIVASWILDPKYVRILIKQDMRRIASTLLLAEPEPDRSISFAERLGHLVYTDYTMIAASHACAIYELYIENFRTGEQVDLNKTGYLNSTYAHSWMPIADIERALRLAILVRRFCAFKIQKLWRRHKTISILKTTSYLLVLRVGNSNLLKQTGHHLMPHKYEHAVDLSALHH